MLWFCAIIYFFGVFRVQCYAISIKKPAFLPENQYQLIQRTIISFSSNTEVTRTMRFIKSSLFYH